MQNQSITNPLLQALYLTDPDHKVELIRQIWRGFLVNPAEFFVRLNAPFFLQDIPQQPSYQDLAPVVDKSAVQQRSNLNTREGFGALVHAIAHIEFSAIDLALETALWGLSSSVPIHEYSADWLRVAYEESCHFMQLAELLSKLDYRYGDFAVHNELFSASRKCDTLLMRMAVVPRYLEAMGLDANPKIRHKIKSCSHPFKGDLEITLDTIMREEIGHVALGDKWFKYLCQQSKMDPACYFELIRRVFPKGGRNLRDVNRQARIAAGFSESELEQLGGSE